MANEFIRKQDTNTVDTTQNKSQKGLPFIALVLSFVPFLYAFFGSRGVNLPSFTLLFGGLSPIAGFITGIISLCRGRRQIGIVGMIFSIIAIALPTSTILLILVVFTGVSTGVISFM